MKILTPVAFIIISLASTMGCTTTIDKNKYKAMIKKAREDGYAIDMEEYIEGIRAFAFPLNINRTNLQVAIWAVGLKGQITDETIPKYTEYLKGAVKEIEARFVSG